MRVHTRLKSSANWEAAMTARSEILEAAKSLTNRGISPFSPIQLIREIEQTGTSYPEETLRTHITSWMCVDAPGHNPSYRDLKRVGHGQYVLLEDAGKSTGRASRRRQRNTAPVTQRQATATELSGRPWSWEGNVQRVFVDHLAKQGWEIVTAADTASREPGPDVVARRNDQQLIIEVKGYPDSERASANTQARHYTAGALLTALLAWAENPKAIIGLVFPEAVTYRNLLKRLRTPLERLDVSVWFVHENERVELWLDRSRQVRSDL